MVIALNRAALSEQHETTISAMHERTKVGYWDLSRRYGVRLAERRAQHKKDIASCMTTGDGQPAW
jgi:hypothetical protein